MSIHTRVACDIAFGNYLKELPEDYVTKLQTIFDYVPENFIRRSASSTKKYHAPYENSQPWGLLLHTVSVCRVAVDLLRARPSLEEKYKNKVIVACILHDMCKYHKDNDLKEHTSKSHDIEAADMARIAGFDTDICGLIRCHQGTWNSKGYDDDTGSCDFAALADINFDVTQLPEDLKECVRIVHYADIIASRTYININYDGLIFELNNALLLQLGLDTSGIVGYNEPEPKSAESAK